jgi:hypothetical protein
MPVRAWRTAKKTPAANVAYITASGLRSNSALPPTALVAATPAPIRAAVEAGARSSRPVA